MRKFLVILLCLSILGIPFTVSAAETETTIHGAYIFNDVLTIPPWTTNHLEEVDFYTGTLEEVNENTQLSGVAYNFAGDILSYTIIGSDGSQKIAEYAYNFTTNTWYSADVRRVHFESRYEQSVSEGFYDWFIANTTEVFCDGSTCTVDDPTAEFCDDCHARLRLASPPSSEVAPYPSYLPPFDTGYWNVVYTYGSDTYLVSMVTDSPNGRFYGENETNKLFVGYSNFIIYKLNGEEWERLNYINTISELCTLSDVVWSSKDIYYENGELFFPLPLWAQVLKVTEREVEVETVPTMTNSAVSLAVCGIGCLALLISLVLLVRVLRKYLKR